MSKGAILARSKLGVVTSPHFLATESGLKVLRQGGNAIEAALATAATLAVVYPHMNSLGGDGFWLIAGSDGRIRGLCGAGPAGKAYTAGFYRQLGLAQIPERGSLAVNTVAGIVGLWAAAYDYSVSNWQGRFSWGDLLEDAVRYAEDGVTITKDCWESFIERKAELEEIAEFRRHFIQNGQGLALGRRFVMPNLSQTFKQLQIQGAESFYRGHLASRILAGLKEVGSRLCAEDFNDYSPQWVEPITVPYQTGTLVNMPPPSQGLASLMILALLERCDLQSWNHLSAEYIHHVVEATKLAFAIRDRYVADPAFTTVPISELLSDAFLGSLASKINPGRARPYPTVGPSESDTVWYGVVDSAGRAVSAIQSIYHPFGSGIVVGDTGILWQNRGCAFSLNPHDVNCIAPGKRPRHTLNPAMYLSRSGINLVYGTMGGEGQPQTQAALVTRVIDFGLSLQEAIDAPRWVFGRTWGAQSYTLKLEDRFDPSVYRTLEGLGHRIELVAPYFRLMGHAGMVRLQSDVGYEAVSDPRSDGAAMGL